MTIAINLSNGTPLITLADGTSDAVETSLTLLGSGASGYPLAITQNFVRLLENFANDIPPPSPLEGQLWFDTNDLTLKLFTGGTWRNALGDIERFNTKAGAIGSFYMKSPTKVWKITIDDTGAFASTLAV